MRLTLRTLLAYLDDTLEPTQAKLIGQKVAESDQARELIERIQTGHAPRVASPRRRTRGRAASSIRTRSASISTTTSPRSKAAEVEEICLASDTHLAEVAACHQILALILGEPALVPPSARQRMYGLVKGPEAIPFRKPPATAPRADVVVPEGRDVDDTLPPGHAAGQRARIAAIRGRSSWAGSRQRACSPSPFGRSSRIPPSRGPNRTTTARRSCRSIRARTSRHRRQQGQGHSEQERRSEREEGREDERIQGTDARSSCRRWCWTPAGRRRTGPCSRWARWSSIPRTRSRRSCSPTTPPIWCGSASGRRTLR